MHIDILLEICQSTWNQGHQETFSQMDVVHPPNKNILFEDYKGIKLCNFGVLKIVTQDFNNIQFWSNLERRCFLPCPPFFLRASWRNRTCAQGNPLKVGIFHLVNDLFTVDPIMIPLLTVFHTNCDTCCRILVSILSIDGIKVYAWDQQPCKIVKSFQPRPLFQLF